ncbi:transmembrane domain- and RING domain-containing protein 4 [Trametes pubescens]|uniref:Transmembrane domain-and RING domain-containing protein 4 n=1 Tax=Trametes pubescens TaxID=154538 RepID=A0A1M2VE36_TRAPU|nr:transmembrane domain- and RING domain-containing protein 4 [Trametes pubescens]
MRSPGLDIRSALGSGSGSSSRSGALGLGMLLHWATIAAALVFLAALPTPGHAYIPAQGTNETGVAQAAGINFTDVSRLSLQWFPMGSYSETVSYQLVGADSLGISKGALVHFSEDKLLNDTSGTPWIALVSCDANSTNASMEDDIFTLARDRGAVAALLYSLKSVTCIINTEYSNPAKFDQVMDIFATQALTSSQLIEDQFENSSSKYYWFSASTLNDSSDAIQTAIMNHTMPQTGYLFATLAAWNATDNSTATGTATSIDGGQSGGPQDKNTNTSLAMIILYAITGCVSALFCVVIISGAVRAIRHPERYGPRSAGTDGFAGPQGAFGPQSRARGLTRAILDTFPVVKFGRADAPTDAPASAKDIESVGTDDLPYTSRDSKSSARAPPDDAQGVEVELREWQIAASQLDEPDSKARQDVGDIGDDDVRAHALAAVPTLRHGPHADAQEEDEDPSKRASSSSHVPPAVPRPMRRPPREDVRASAAGERDVVPDAIGRETCPICIVDFEEGDDLRVLPCEGHHRFHQECVDQWLLELSSSCPLCRQDFHALQTMMAAGDDGEHLEPPHMLGAARPMSTAAARFSRYLKFARRRRQQRPVPGDLGGYDTTNRPMSVAEEPSA